MAVHLRLSRIGKKGAPFYRIVAIDSRKSRDGEALDILGTYDPLKGKVIVLNFKRVQDWIDKGAQPTDSVRKIFKLAKKQGFVGYAKSPVVVGLVEEIKIEMLEEAKNS